MRYTTLILISLVILASCKTTQVPAQNKPFLKQRSDASVVALDQRLFAGMNFKVPVLSDTILLGGLDSIGSMLKIKSGSKAGLWVRDTVATGGHVWVKLASFSSSDIASINYWTLADSVLYPKSLLYGVGLGTTGSVGHFSVTLPTTFTLNSTSETVSISKTGTVASLVGSQALFVNTRQNTFSGGQMLASTAFFNNRLTGSGSAETLDSSSLNNAVATKRTFFTSGTGINLRLTTNETLPQLSFLLQNNNATTVLPNIDSANNVTESDTTHTWNVDVPITNYYSYLIVGNRGNLRRFVDYYAGSLAFQNQSLSTFRVPAKIGLYIAKQNSSHIDTSRAIYQADQNDTSQFNGYLQIGQTPTGSLADSVLVKHNGIIRAIKLDSSGGGGGVVYTFFSPLQESGGNVTIDNATTLAKGVASFYTSDFTVTAAQVKLNYPNLQVVDGTNKGVVTPTLYNFWNAKSPLITGALTPYLTVNGTASRAVGMDGSGKLTTLSTTTTEIGYVSGVTSAIQTQLNAKQTTTLPSGQFLIGSAGNVATGRTITGDITFSNTGVGSLSVLGSAGACSDCNLSIDINGRITAYTDGTGGGGGAGTVTAVTGTTPIVITSNPLVTPNVTIQNGKADGGTTPGAVSFTANNFNDNGSGLIDLDMVNGQKATDLIPGFMSASDHALLTLRVPSSRTVSTTLPMAGGGDLSADRTLSIGGLSTLGTANYIVGVNAGATAWEYKQLIAGSNVIITQGVGTVTIASSGGGGGVSSVGLAAPTGFTVTGSPVTGSGTLTLSTTLNGLLYGNGSNIIAAATITSPLTFSAGTLSIPLATSSVSGYLSSTDRALFFSKQDVATGWVTPVMNANLTANRVAISDGAGKAAASTTTTTELGFVSGVTSSIQTQLNAPFVIQALTDAATITWNSNNGYNATVTLAGNRTLSITNAVAGHSGRLKVSQDVTGGRTLTLPANSKVRAGDGVGTTIILTSTTNAVDYISYFYDGSFFWWVRATDFN